MTIWWPRFDDVQAWLDRGGYRSRDWGALGACLDRPLTTLAGREAYPTVWLKVAALLDSVERNHPLIDGNKLVGFLLASLVLKANGFDDAAVSDDHWYELIMAVASDHPEVEEIARRLESLFAADGAA